MTTNIMMDISQAVAAVYSIMSPIRHPSETTPTHTTSNNASSQLNPQLKSSDNDGKDKLLPLSSGSALAGTSASSNASLAVSSPSLNNNANTEPANSIYISHLYYHSPSIVTHFPRAAQSASLQQLISNFSWITTSSNNNSKVSWINNETVWY